jgi:hypothetical protein
MLLQQRDEIIHWLRVQVQTGSALARLDEARRRARLFRVRHEVEEDEIHVLDLVSAVANKLIGDHAGWDVPAQA